MGSALVCKPEMIIDDGSQPTAAQFMEAAKPYREAGSEWHWQYKGDWGWKTMDP
jgi:hypothetical protein